MPELRKIIMPSGELVDPKPKAEPQPLEPARKRRRHYPRLPVSIYLDSTDLIDPESIRYLSIEEEEALICQQVRHGRTGMSTDSVTEFFLENGLVY